MFKILAIKVNNNLNKISVIFAFFILLSLNICCLGMDTTLPATNLPVNFLPSSSSSSTSSSSSVFLPASLSSISTLTGATTSPSFASSQVSASNLQPTLISTNALASTIPTSSSSSNSPTTTAAIGTVVSSSNSIIKLPSSFNGMEVSKASLSKLYFNLAEAFRHVKKYSEAKRNYEYAINLQSNDDFCQALGELIHQKDYKNCARDYNDFGNILFKQKKYSEAAQQFEDAIKLEPNNAYAYNRLGITLRELKQYEDAEKKCRKAIELGLNTAYAHNDLGDILYDLQRYPEAKEKFEKAISLEPNNAYSYYHLGDTFIKQNKYEEAKQAYIKSIRLDPNEIVIKVLMQLLDQTETHAYVYNDFGNTLFDLKKYSAATEAFKGAINLEPNNAYSYNRLATTFKEMKEYGRAIKNFEESIELGVNTVCIHNELGCALLYKDITDNNFHKSSGAKVEFKKIIKLEPNNANFYSNLGDCYTKFMYGHLSWADVKAEQNYRKAIELGLNTPQIHNNLGSVLTYLGKYPEAKQEFETAINLDPNDAYAYLGLQEAFFGLANYDESAKFWVKALKMLTINGRYSGGSSSEPLFYYWLLTKDFCNPPDNEIFKKWQPKTNDLIEGGDFLLGLGYSSYTSYSRVLFSMAINQEPNNAYPYNRLGVALQLYPEESTIKWPSNFKKTLVILGIISKKEFEEEEYIYIKHIVKAVNSSSLGDTPQELKQYKKDEKNRRKAIELSRSTAYRYNVIEKLYRKAIELGLNTSYAHNDLGNLLYDLKRYSEAKEEFEKAISLEPGNAYAYSRLGAALGELSQYEEAEKKCRKAIELGLNTVWAHNNFGVALYNLGKYSEAKEEFEKAINAEPDTDDFEKAIKLKPYKDYALHCLELTIKTLQKEIEKSEAEKKL